MGQSIVADEDPESEEALLLSFAAATSTIPTLSPYHKIPKDTSNLAYIIYFTLGAGFLFPWNAFITAVDYFSYLYPEASVDRTFSVVYMVVDFVCVSLVVLFAHKSNSFVRINVGLALFMVSLLVVPIMDVWYIKGEVGFYNGFYVTVGAVAVCGVADGLVQGGVVGAAGELPERYMQAVISGTAASEPSKAEPWPVTATRSDEVDTFCKLSNSEKYKVCRRLPLGWKLFPEPASAEGEVPDEHLAGEQAVANSQVHIELDSTNEGEISKKNVVVGSVLASVYASNKSKVGGLATGGGQTKHVEASGRKKHVTKPAGERNVPPLDPKGEEGFGPG